MKRKDINDYCEDRESFHRERFSIHCRGGFETRTYGAAIPIAKLSMGSPWIELGTNLLGYTVIFVRTVS